jgi:YD repeat-containing protein
LSETDAENQTTTWGYDFMGRKVRRTLPLGQIESWTYDYRGNVKTHTDFEGKVTIYMRWIGDGPNLFPNGLIFDATPGRTPVCQELQESIIRAESIT